MAPRWDQVEGQVGPFWHQDPQRRTQVRAKSRKLSISRTEMGQVAPRRAKKIEKGDETSQRPAARAGPREVDLHRIRAYG